MSLGARGRGGPAPVPPTIGEQTRNQLRDLGYGSASLDLERVPLPLREDLLEYTRSLFGEADVTHELRLAWSLSRDARNVAAVDGGGDAAP